MSDLNKVKKLNPFGKFCCTIGHIPTSYMEALTYEEQLLWFCNFLQNTVIPTVNNNADAVEELQNLYIELHNYVENYFDNLDVQEEINNKLDEMAENGTLDEIIERYINTKLIRFYDNINNLINDENIVENTTVITNGYTYFNDKGNGIYKILDDNVSLNSDIQLNNGLIARLVKDNSNIEYIFPKSWSYRNSGDIIIIKALGKILMIDTDTNTNWDKVEEMLEDNNITHLDYFFLSHYHIDHMGNFVSLVNNNYIDNNTILYLPQVNETMEADYKYQEVMEIINEKGFDYIIPEENSILNLGMNITLKFYNTDETYISSLSDWNNASMLILLIHGNSKTLFTGDAQGNAMRRAVDNGFINEKIELLKLNHHGVIIENDSSVRAMEILQPKFAIQTAQLLNHRNRFQFNGDIAYLKGIGTKLFATYFQDDYVKFESSINTLTTINGKPLTGISNSYYSRTLKVNASATNNFEDGTDTYPFHDLIKALASIDKNASGCDYIIELADGDYSTGNEVINGHQLYSPVFASNDVVISIRGNSSDRTAVKIHNGLIFRNANIDIQHCTIYNDNSEGIYANKTNITILDCIVRNSTNEIVNNRAIRATNDSKMFIINSEIAYSNEAVRSVESIITLINSNINNCTRALYNENGIINVKENCTFETITNTDSNNGIMNKNYYKQITNDMLETNLTVNTNFAEYISCKNNTVSIKAVINKSDNFATGSTADIFTTNYKLPEYLRPSKNIKVPVFFGSGSYALSDIGYAVIKSNGGLYVQNNGSTNLGNVTIDICYTL